MNPGATPLAPPILVPHLVPEPFNELLVGVFFLVVVIFVHGFGLRAIVRHYSRRRSLLEHAGRDTWESSLVLSAVISALAVLHMTETLVWAVPICLTNIIPQMRDSYFYVLESYTTLGEGTVTLPDAWRLIGPMIAMSGLFTFGWTGSVLVNVMSDFLKFDRYASSHAHKER